MHLSIGVGKSTLHFKFLKNLMGSFLSSGVISLGRVVVVPYTKIVKKLPWTFEKFHCSEETADSKI